MEEILLAYKQLYNKIESLANLAEIICNQIHQAKDWELYQVTFLESGLSCVLIDDKNLCLDYSFFLPIGLLLGDAENIDKFIIDEKRKLITPTVKCIDKLMEN